MKMLTEIKTFLLFIQNMYEKYKIEIVWVRVGD